jgi:hypothetical protein
MYWLFWNWIYHRTWDFSSGSKGIALLNFKQFNYCNLERHWSLLLTKNWTADNKPPPPPLFLYYYTNYPKYHKSLEITLLLYKYPESYRGMSKTCWHLSITIDLRSVWWWGPPSVCWNPHEWEHDPLLADVLKSFEFCIKQKFNVMIIFIKVYSV